MMGSNNDVRVCQVAAGHSHSGAITEAPSASLYLWGANEDHRLMTEDSVSRLTPGLTILEQIKQQLLR